MLGGPTRARLLASRPWLILAAVGGVAIWHALDFSEAADSDFPRIVRPFFNAWPPSAYRLAEPGDTLDRVGLYFASVASAMAVLAIHIRVRSRSVALWPSALALALGAAWHASTPGPSFDGWPGLGWRVMLDPSASVGVRLAMAVGAIGLLGTIGVNLAIHGWRGATEPSGQADRKLAPLLIFAATFVLFGLQDWPGLEPVGYWTRCAFDLGILAFVLALARARPLEGLAARRRPMMAFAAIASALIFAGISVANHHRPLARLHAVVPGRIYISAMPTYRGLAIEQDRLHFKTIINLFDEASTQGSPRHSDEIRFVRERGLRYLGSPSDGLESDRFLDETLALARDPDAWPILVHCHGCMDRSPAWMGLYRFLVEGKPLDAIFREIERHRGSRPKALVSLQYLRKLPPRAPRQFEDDPTTPLLRRAVAGTEDPFLRPGWNSTATTRKVVTRIEPDPKTRRP